MRLPTFTRPPRKKQKRNPRQRLKRKWRRVPKEVLVKLNLLQSLKSSLSKLWPKKVGRRKQFRWRNERENSLIITAAQLQIGFNKLLVQLVILGKMYVHSNFKPCFLWSLKISMITVTKLFNSFNLIDSADWFETKDLLSLSWREKWCFEWDRRVWLMSSNSSWR